MERFELAEEICASKPSKIDRTNGVLEDVKIVGLSSPSKNRDYTPEALKAAMPLYEGVKVNVDHSGAEGGSINRRSRRYEDRFGRLTGIYFKEGEGLFAKTFSFNPEHRLAKSLCWWAENDPSGVGFSQVANGKGRVVRGRQIIESIERVSSVDLVADPATTAGLFESESEEEEEDDVDLKEAYSDRRSKKSSALLASEYSDNPGSMTAAELEESGLTQAEAEAAGIEVMDSKELSRHYRER